MLKKQLNKWQIFCKIVRVPEFYDPFTLQLGFGIMNFISLPEEGKPLSKKDYKGFFIEIVFWLPIYIKKH